MVINIRSGGCTRHLSVYIPFYAVYITFVMKNLLWYCPSIGMRYCYFFPEPKGVCWCDQYAFTNFLAGKAILLLPGTGLPNYEQLFITEIVHTMQLVCLEFIILSAS